MARRGLGRASPRELRVRPPGGAGGGEGLWWAPGQEGVRRTHLFDGVQHGPPSVPWLGGLADAVEAGHAVPLPVLQLPVEGVGQHQHTVIQVEVGDLRRQGRVTLATVRFHRGRASGRVVRPPPCEWVPSLRSDPLAQVHPPNPGGWAH